MKIQSLETFHLCPRWMFLKITTNEGISGWGEPVLEGRAQTVETALREMAPLLIGQDPLRIEHLWQTLYRSTAYRGGPILTSALSGVEMALWDIKGKACGQPVYQLLGGKCRDRVRMYGHLKPTGHPGDFPIEAMLEITRGRLAEGFTVMKYSIIPPIRPIDSPAMVEAAVERFAAVRECIGKNVDLAIDFHGRVSPAMSRRLLAALEPYYPLFVEEPVLPENVDALAAVARGTSIPIAAGERLFTRWGYRELIEKQAVSVVQPDLCHCGGILEARKIAALAENYYMTYAPHNPLGPISLAACLQLDACAPNLLAQEHPGMPDGQDLGVGILTKPFVIEKDGCIRIPDGPGLGIEVDESRLEELAFPGAWDTPRLFFEDGSIADW